MAGEGGQPKKYFSVPEVEALIPELTRIMESIMDANSEARRLQAALQEEQQRIMVSGGAILDAAQWKERAGRLEALARQLQEGIDAIVRLGGVPKDLGMGLVDFPFLLEGEEVDLCWRFGERKIRFWHGLDEGFAGRKPIPDELT
jgi:hypothetical protein